MYCINAHLFICVVLYCTADCRKNLVDMISVIFTILLAACFPRCIAQQYGSSIVVQVSVFDRPFDSNRPRPVRPNNNHWWFDDWSPFDDDRNSDRSHEPRELSVTRICKTSKKCTICVDGQCYKNIRKVDLRVQDGCPPAVCDSNCARAEFVKKDNCPVCNCLSGHYSTREPCTYNDDCLEKPYKCSNNVCRYNAVKKNSARYCTASFECPEVVGCKNHTCGIQMKYQHHLEGTSCDRIPCPNNYVCIGRTCWIQKATCSRDDDCMQNYLCSRKGWCKRKKYVQKERGIKYAEQPVTTSTTEAYYPSCRDCWWYEVCVKGRCVRLVDHVLGGK